MRDPTIAPFFACMYPGLCHIARDLGYALALHGTMTSDLDLIAVPWTETAADAWGLKEALMKHINALDFRQWIAHRTNLTEAAIQEECERVDEIHPNGTPKPHGRLAWNLYLDHGVKIDLSVMPKIKQHG